MKTVMTNDMDKFRVIMLHCIGKIEGLAIYGAVSHKAKDAFIDVAKILLKLTEELEMKHE